MVAFLPSLLCTSTAVSFLLPSCLYSRLAFFLFPPLLLLRISSTRPCPICNGREQDDHFPQESIPPRRRRRRVVFALPACANIGNETKKERRDSSNLFITFLSLSSEVSIQCHAGRPNKWWLPTALNFHQNFTACHLFLSMVWARRGDT